MGRMFQLWMHMLEERSWRVIAQEWSRNTTAERDSALARTQVTAYLGDPIRNVGRAEGFKVLRTLFTSKSSDRVKLPNRPEGLQGVTQCS